MGGLVDPPGGSMAKTPYRPLVGGLTAREFAHVGTSDLKAWREYWERVRDGKRKPNPGNSLEAAAGEVAKLTREIDARISEGYAGPDRHRSWGP
jgi:hypothetical protein